MSLYKTYLDYYKRHACMLNSKRPCRPNSTMDLVAFFDEQRKSLPFFCFKSLIIIPKDLDQW